ncbi:MAG: hypothetical protein GY710_02210 [Desulfobacteraceae bacterium]|nr:hypothetical protein [Desulfobacteraceae bacterium]
MSFSQSMSEANDKGFQRKIKLSMQRAAIAVMAESSETSNHAERVIYAKKVLNGEALIYEYCVGIVTNSTIAAAIAADTDFDSSIDFTVDSMFDAFAGVST